MRNKPNLTRNNSKTAFYELKSKKGAIHHNVWTKLNAGVRACVVYRIVIAASTSLVALLKLCSCCLVAVCVLCLFLMMQWVGLQCVIVAFSGHTYLFLKSACAIFHHLFLDSFHDKLLYGGQNLQIFQRLSCLPIWLWAFLHYVHVLKFDI